MFFKTVTILTAIHACFCITVLCMPPAQMLWDRGENTFASQPKHNSGIFRMNPAYGEESVESKANDSPAFDQDEGQFVVNVANIEELYAAVNNVANVGATVTIAPGTYLLSVSDPGGAARPNGGRLELQVNMSLQGVVGDRSAVVIDAIALPASSYTTPIPSTGVIRMGKGNNSIEWLTVKNSTAGGAGIIVHLTNDGLTNNRVAHVSSHTGSRGIDIRNVGAISNDFVINAELTDNDFFNTTAEGIRIANVLDQDGADINAQLSDNRSHHNRDGMLVVNQRSNGSNISVTSTRDHFYENADGVGIIGGLTLASASLPANGNTINFAAVGSVFENNNGSTQFDVGGLIILGGDNTTNPNGTSNNLVNVELRSCWVAFNQVHDIVAIGARLNPAVPGTPGTNNRVNLTLLGVNRRFVVEEFADSIPVFPGGLNSVTVTRWPKY